VRLRLNAAALAGLDPTARRAAEAALRELEALRHDNPLVFYEPHAKQREFHESRAPLRAFLGGNRSGKTTSSIVDDLIQAIDVSAVPAHLIAYKRWEPPFFCRVVIPDLTSTLEGVVLMKIREWCPPRQLRGGSFETAWSDKLRLLSFDNGSWLQFMSNDQDLDKFGGSALHRVHFDEEPRQDVRRENMMRLIDYGGDEVYSMTPLLGMSWMYTDIYEPWVEGQLPDCHVTTVDMDDNPHLDEVTKRRALAGLSDEERHARKSGRFVSFSGLVYPEFGPALIVPDGDRVPDGAVVVVGIDPGIRHLAAVVYTYLDADDRLVVFDEIAVQGRTVAEVARLIHARNERWRISPRNVIDPAARNRETHTGRSTQAEFAEHGIHTFAGQNAHEAGINRVKERLQTGRLIVWASCEELIREFKRYRWKSPPRSGEGDPREVPVAKDDHCLDALRYVCMSRPVAPARPPTAASTTLQDRLLRAQLDRLVRPRLTHPQGPGVWV
jgi:phage terminase large subunit-like protein